MHKTREDRQTEAVERQQRRDARTTSEQLARIRRRPGKSADETARLLSLRALERTTI